jgi:hypothetical protein
MILKSTLLFFIEFMTLALIFYSPDEAVSSSPAFVRQEILDNRGDWWDHLQGNFTTGHNFSDIIAISYLSDGRFLNVTIFLNSKFVEEPDGYMPAYGAMIDTDSNGNTGWQGYDYFMRIAWDNFNKVWTYVLQEWSTAQIARILDQKSNYTDFFEKGENNNYTRLSLDLEKLNFPTEYTVVFFTDYIFEKDSLYGVSDYSSWIRIPPPEFFITLIPNELTLRPGEDRIVEVRFNSSTEVFGAHVTLSTNQIDGFESYFINNERDIPTSGLATSDLYIRASKDAQPKPYTLQMLANISFPTQYISREEQLKTTSDNITEILNLPITILQPLTFGEEFSAFWDTYGGALSLVGGGFAAGFAALVFDKLRRTKQK